MAQPGIDRTSREPGAGHELTHRARPILARIGGVRARVNRSYLTRLIQARRQSGPLGISLARSSQIPRRTRNDEGIARTQAAHSQPPNAVIAEIGSFLGCSTVLWAEARTLSGSGTDYCVDPFDG